MGNKNCWIEVFQLKNASLKYKEKLLNFSESILSTRAPPLFITNKYTKEIYNISGITIKSTSQVKWYH